MSEALHKGPCPKCGSRDNLVTYDDGHVHCFGCGHHAWADGSAPPPATEKRVTGLIPVGEAMAIPARRLTEETCSKWGYTVSEMRGQKVQVANYRNIAGQVIAQKVRFANKDFSFLGDAKDPPLYGQHLWRDGGRRVVITEGELDALSVSQAQGNKWPVVSLPTGAGPQTLKSVSQNIEWLLGFEEVVLMFDNDEKGQAASAAVAGLFPPGRCKIAKLPLKDASDMLKAGREKDIVGAIFEAKTYRPDGVVTVADVRDRVLAPVTVGLPWFIPRLTDLTYGRRLGEIYGLGAGTGVGKTDFLTEQIKYDTVDLGLPVAVFALEQHPVETVKRVAGKRAGKRFHVPDGSWSSDELVAALDGLETGGKLFMYDSFGATDWEVISKTIRFLSHAEGVRIFYLDHLTALAAAESDERTALERIMAEMAMLAKELQIVIIFVSHLSTPDGKPHEEGGRVMIRHFKGSRAIGFWSHFMFGMERDQQAEDETLRTITTFRVLKDRFTGSSTGQCVYLQYEKENGRLNEVEGNPFADADEGAKHFPDSNAF